MSFNLNVSSNSVSGATNCKATTKKETKDVLETTQNNNNIKNALVQSFDNEGQALLGVYNKAMLNVGTINTTNFSAMSNEELVNFATSKLGEERCDEITAMMEQYPGVYENTKQEVEDATADLVSAGTKDAIAQASMLALIG